jgi:hypothetical protein
VSLAEDLDAAAAHGGRPKRWGCSVCKILPTLSSQDRESLRRALDSPIGAYALRDVLIKHGLEVGVPSIRNHRRGNCS